MKTMIQSLILCTLIFTATACSKPSARPVETESYRLATKQVGADDYEYYLLRLADTGKFEYFKFSITSASSNSTRNEQTSSCHDYYTRGDEVWEIVIPSGSGDVALPFLGDGTLSADESVSPEIAPLTGNALTFYRVSAEQFEALYSGVQNVGATVARCTP